MHVSKSFLMNSGDMVLHHFGTFGTRLWPTKMQARMAFNHSKIRDPVRGRKVGCNSLNAKKRGVAARVANKLWKPRFDRLLQQVCKPCKYAHYDTVIPLKNNLWSGHVYWAFCRTGLATIAKGTVGEFAAKEKDKRRDVAALWSSNRFESKGQCNWGHLSMESNPICDFWWSQCVLFDVFHEIMIASRSHLRFVLCLISLLSFLATLNVQLLMFFPCCTPK